ncbi:UDP-N-acetylmuramate--L-alanine ligase [Spirosoma sp.]|uniref:UDP-N-acetylmuramate--L-alanine ligase n=1 Tax=Spirosoma sp. TaxID=1899569 RepID=UPI003B3B2FCD
MPKAIHFISIGGSAMHNLAIALQQQGYTVTGSDNEIYNPSQSRLQQHGLLPSKIGWFPEKIHPELTAVIVGMHAHKDNPELVKALELGLPVYSYPEFIYYLSQQKQRVVIAGSHGKTIITAMILHALKFHNRNFDYWIGDQIDGFDSTVKITTDTDGSAAPIIIIEADEYASSPIDSRPKFLHYQPHIALISGIAWEHVSTYPTWDEYVDQFESLAEAMPKAGILIFDESDDMLDVIGQKERKDITKIPYEAHPNKVVNDQTQLITKQSSKISVQLFGEHNMKNIAGAMAVCDRIGITEDQFYEAIPSFTGIPQRLEKIVEEDSKIIYLDLAQSPTTVAAVVEAVKHQHPSKKLMALLELSTINNPNKSFLEQYKNTLDTADLAIVYLNKEHLIISNQTSSIKLIDVLSFFDKEDLQVFTNLSDLHAYLLNQRDAAQIFLLMSTGKIDGIDIREIAEKLISAD